MLSAVTRGVAATGGLSLPQLAAAAIAVTTASPKAPAITWPQRRVLAVAARFEGSNFDLRLRMQPTKRFTGLKLSARDQSELKRMQSGRVRMSVRTWRRIRVLFLLNDGHSVRSTAISVGGYPREVSRVGKRYTRCYLVSRFVQYLGFRLE